MKHNGCGPLILAGWLLLAGFVYVAWALFQWGKP